MGVAGQELLAQEGWFLSGPGLEAHFAAMHDLANLEETLQV